MTSSREYNLPPRDPGCQEPLLEQGELLFSPGVTPTPSQADMKRADYSQRGHTVTGKSIEPYIGKYTYIIGQSKYYLQRKSMRDQRTHTDRRQADKKGPSPILGECVLSNEDPSLMCLIELIN